MGYYLDEKSNLPIYVRQVDVRQRFLRSCRTIRHTVRGAVALDVGVGRQSGVWSDAFIERAFPAAERAQSDYQARCILAAGFFITSADVPMTR